MESNVTGIARDTMTLEELAERMGVSLTVGYELAKRNALPVPVIKIGRQYRFSRRAYERLLDAQHSEEDSAA
jgi:excisionase family DNA binding protein